jgi:hypothetical protein
MEQYAIVKPNPPNEVALLTGKLTRSDPEPPSPEHRNFSRGLGLSDSVMLVVGAMIGFGIFIVPAEMSRQIGSAGWLLVAWVVAGALTTSNLVIFLRDSGKAGSFLIDRPRDIQPSHLSQQRGSFQSQFRRCAAWSTNDPANPLQCFHNQSTIGVFQGHP